MFPNGDYRSVDFSESFEHRVSSEDPFFFFFFFYVNVIVYDLVYIYRIIAIVAIS